MKNRLLYLTIGTAFGITGHYAYRQYKPQRIFTLSKQQLINSYITKHQLQQGYLITVLNSLGFLLKDFYNHGMDTTLKGFNYNSTFLKKDEVRDQQKEIKHLYCIFSPTEYICGHPEIQHGGATAALIDHSFGYLTILNSKSSVATADLRIKYKRPIKKDQFYVFQGQVIEKIGRKIKVKGLIKQLQTGEIKVETQGLFLTVNWDNQLSRVLTKFFKSLHFKDYAEVHHNPNMHADYRHHSNKLSQKEKQTN